MRLVLRNPFQHHFKVRMGMMPLDHPNLLKTSSCPVRAGLLGIEMWPHPIFQVWLARFPSSRRFQQHGLHRIGLTRRL